MAQAAVARFEQSGAVSGIRPSSSAHQRINAPLRNHQTDPRRQTWPPVRSLPAAVVLRPSHADSIHQKRYCNAPPTRAPWTRECLSRTAAWLANLDYSAEWPATLQYILDRLDEVSRPALRSQCASPPQPMRPPTNPRRSSTTSPSRPRACPPRSQTLHRSQTTPPCQARDQPRTRRTRRPQPLHAPRPSPSSMRPSRMPSLPPPQPSTPQYGTPSPPTLPSTPHTPSSVSRSWFSSPKDATSTYPRTCALSTASSPCPRPSPSSRCPKLSCPAPAACSMEQRPYRISRHRHLAPMNPSAAPCSHPFPGCTVEVKMS